MLFNDHLDNSYTQTDDVALRIYFRKFYMAHLENKIFYELNKSTMYVRYTDDIFIQEEYVNDILEFNFVNFEIVL